MENLVYRTRERAYPEWKQLIFSEPFRWVGPTDERSFTRFQFQVMIGKEAQEFVGFAHPDILFELGQTRLHGFVDCTFSVVPKLFKQVMVIMLYFSKYDLYVPVYFILLQVHKCYAFCISSELINVF
jgi:hypothetical protein